MQIQTERFYIREFRESDVEPVKRYQSDVRYLEHYQQKPNAKQIIDRAMLWATTSPRINFQLAISLTYSGDPIGNVGVRGSNYPVGEAELGVEIDPTYWKQGYAHDAVSHMLQFAAQKNLTRLHAVTKPSNIRAINLVQSFGFSHQGVKGEDALYELHL